MKDKKLEKGENIARYSGPVTVLKWHDKRNVTMVPTYHTADTQRVSNKGKETEKPLCVIDYNHKKGGSRFEGPVAAHVHGREEKNDQMVPQTFQQATELYSSQFVCCLSTSDGNTYTAALALNSASGRSVYETCPCCRDAECTGATGIQEHSSTAD